jgi:hypothetical protein
MEVPAARSPRSRSSGYLLVAAVSGVLSYVAGVLPEPYVGLGLSWGAGLLFGALVLAPGARSWWRRIAVVVASVLVYRAAVWLATVLVVETPWPEIPACQVAGAVAAPVLRLATQPLLGGRSSLGRHLVALATGATGGVLIGVAVTGSNEGLLGLPLPLLAGYLVWQFGYAAAHGRPGEES